MWEETRGCMASNEQKRTRVYAAQERAFYQTSDGQLEEVRRWLKRSHLSLSFPKGWRPQVLFLAPVA